MTRPPLRLITTADTLARRASAAEVKAIWLRNMRPKMGRGAWFAIGMVVGAVLMAIVEVMR